ncbi:hypothetical protein ACHAXT_002062 [Thalassiosira profunda]
MVDLHRLREPRVVKAAILTASLAAVGIGIGVTLGTRGKNSAPVAGGGAPAEDAAPGGPGGTEFVEKLLPTDGEKATPATRDGYSEYVEVRDHRDGSGSAEWGSSSDWSGGGSKGSKCAGSGSSGKSGKSGSGSSGKSGKSGGSGSSKGSKLMGTSSSSGDWVFVPGWAPSPSSWSSSSNDWDDDGWASSGTTSGSGKSGKSGGRRLGDWVFVHPEDGWNEMVWSSSGSSGKSGKSGGSSGSGSKSGKGSSGGSWDDDGWATPPSGNSWSASGSGSGKSGKSGHSGSGKSGKESSGGSWETSGWSSGWSSSSGSGKSGKSGHSGSGKSGKSGHSGSGKSGKGPSSWSGDWSYSDDDCDETWGSGVSKASKGSSGSKSSKGSGSKSAKTSKSSKSTKSSSSTSWDKPGPKPPSWSSSSSTSSSWDKPGPKPPSKTSSSTSSSWDKPGPKPPSKTSSSSSSSTSVDETHKPTYKPTPKPTQDPKEPPTPYPTAKPSKKPTKKPTKKPVTDSPTASPATKKPTKEPTVSPSVSPTTPSPTACEEQKFHYTVDVNGSGEQGCTNEPITDADREEYDPDDGYVHVWDSPEECCAKEFKEDCLSYDECAPTMSPTPAPITPSPTSCDDQTFHYTVDVNDSGEQGCTNEPLTDADREAYGESGYVHQWESADECCQKEFKEDCLSYDECAPTMSPTPAPITPSPSSCDEQAFHYTVDVNGSGEQGCTNEPATDEDFEAYHGDGDDEFLHMWDSAAECCQKEFKDECLSYDECAPTMSPTPAPTTAKPSKKPTPSPSKKPNAKPTKKPTAKPTKKPTPSPVVEECHDPKWYFVPGSSTTTSKDSTSTSKDTTSKDTTSSTSSSDTSSDMGGPKCVYDDLPGSSTTKTTKGTKTTSSSHDVEYATGKECCEDNVEHGDVCHIENICGATHEPTKNPTPSPTKPVEIDTPEPTLGSTTASGEPVDTPNPTPAPTLCEERKWHMVSTKELLFQCTNSDDVAVDLYNFETVYYNTLEECCSSEFAEDVEDVAQCLEEAEDVCVEPVFPVPTYAPTEEVTGGSTPTVGKGAEFEEHTPSDPRVGSSRRGLRAAY